MGSPREIEEDIKIVASAGAGAGAARPRPRVPRRPRRSVAIRVTGHETKTSEDHAGTEPPHQGALGIGRNSEGWKPLFWKKLISEYEKEAPLRARHSEAALRVEVKVGHAPDDHTPFTYVDWADPLDARGAVEFARKLVEDGGAQHARVIAHASRPTARRDARDRGVHYDLAKFERES